MTNVKQDLDLPLWAKGCMGALGFFLLVPFVVPALSLMLLSAIPVVVGFIPWLAFRASSARARARVGSRQLSSPSNANDTIHAPIYSREVHA